jgi:hypothetical protein
MDANLLSTWSLMRDKSAPQWDAAQHKAKAVLEARRAAATAEQSSDNTADHTARAAPAESEQSETASEQGEPTAEH